MGPWVPRWADRRCTKPSPWPDAPCTRRVAGCSHSAWCTETGAPRWPATLPSPLTAGCTCWSGPTKLKAAAHHRLDVWVRATFAAACGMRGDTVVVSRDGERTRVDRRPAMAPEQARAALDHLLHLCAHARRYPLPFGPKTSFAVFARGSTWRQRNRQSHAGLAPATPGAAW